MTCEECRNNIASYASGDLPPASREEIGRHLETCEECRRELDEERALLRGAHNASIPFREAVRRGEVRGELVAAEREPKARRVRFTRRRRWQAIIGGSLAAVAAFVALVILRPHGSEIDSVSDWAVAHYPLIDQTHRMGGGSDAVREWFRTHHGVAVTPPQEVDYASLSGCKMTDMGEDPVPLLRFDGNDTYAVFILPPRFGAALRGEGVRGMHRDGYVIDVWSEGPCEYLRITRAKSGS
ncbi:MAG TPA: zf-HC2 domain-containing protein [Bacteroidota bacterium]|nr:zf-HC2 domain-containing protein [Bacteroidota bacterium]